MSDWTEADLMRWDEKILRVAEDLGLDWHPIDYEIIEHITNSSKFLQIIHSTKSITLNC